MKRFPFKSGKPTLPRQKVSSNNAPDVLFSKCLVLNRKGQTQETLQLLRKARGSYETDSRIDMLIAETEFQRGDYGAAVSAYQNVLRLNPPTIGCL